MIARGKIDLAFAVAIAEFQQPAHTVDAQPFDHVARPAAAVGLAGQAPLGREHAIAAHRRNVTLEVGLVAEQAESVLDLPLDGAAPAAGCAWTACPQVENRRAWRLVFEHGAIPQVGSTKVGNPTICKLRTAEASLAEVLREESDTNHRCRITRTDRGFLISPQLNDQMCLLLGPAECRSTLPRFQPLGARA